MIAVCVMALGLVVSAQPAWETSLGGNAGFHIGYKSDPATVKPSVNFMPSGIYPLPEEENDNVTEIDIKNFMENLRTAQDCSPRCQSDDNSELSRSQLNFLLRQLMIMLSQPMNQNSQYLARTPKSCNLFQRLGKSFHALVGECIADRRK
ncbi:hypothetical protein PV327_004719 [Microctonus hyperodae]|uniref:Uncharacterized protein n=1 Tax=Microctonus hyperodae TaxID=165561 RepID=A0AA39FD10_MICHY|nr:hypothetical protein PV327_004719 [Microctonus hyperodae]